EHSVEKDDGVLEETIARDVSDVVVEKAKKKRKRKVTGDASGSTHPPKKLRDDYQSMPPNTSGKSLAALRGLVLDGSGITTVVADVAAILGLNARVESKNLENVGDSAFAGGANADAANISKLNKPSTSSDSFYASQSFDTETMHRVYVPRWKVTNDFVLEDPYVCRGLTYRLAPPALFAQLRAINYDQL
ncbi:hypothetical protein Tco_0325438, partial [Tanacetum coccineum]